MSERDKKSPETAEQIGQELIKFIENTEFGTPQYQAVIDYLHLRQLEKSLKLEQANALSKDDGSERKMHWEFEARISEQEIALHKFQIHQNQSRVQGYDSAYTHVGIGFEHDLSDASHREAKVQFPDDKERQRYYVRDLHSEYFGKAQSTVDAKRG